MHELTSTHDQRVVQESEGKALLALGRQAQRRYFVGDIRQELEDGHPFDIYDEIPVGLLRAINANLNDCINSRGVVVILDFPYQERFKARSQVVKENAYVRQINFDPWPVREWKQGNFSLRVAKPGHRNLRGGLEVQVRKDFGSNVLHATRWDEEEAPGQRFAILTQKGRAWDVILDFRLPDEKTPAWKVNTIVYSH